MVKLLEVDKVTDKESRVTIFADAKSEVTDNITLDELGSGVKLSAGSIAITSGFEVAFLKSDGTWSWKE